MRATSFDLEKYVMFGGKSGEGPVKPRRIQLLKCWHRQHWL